MSEMPSLEPVAGGPETIPETLDIQHDPFPAQDHGISRRIPHLGHALLFFALTATVLFVFLLILAVGFKGRLQQDSGLNTGLSVGAEAATYVVTLVLAYRLFPLLWKKSFLEGIHWNGLVARRNWARLMAAGVSLSMVVQLGEHFVTAPKNAEVDRMMRTPGGAWAVMLLGTLLAPLIEEIAFRGFLLPALATAYDWLSLERTPASVRRWSTSTGHSQAALFFGALLSSVPFALMHAPQLEYAWGPVGLLFLVSLVLALVRVRTHSVACSTLVHLTYNLTIFVIALIATGGFRHLDRL